MDKSLKLGKEIHMRKLKCIWITSVFSSSRSVSQAPCCQTKRAALTIHSSLRGCQDITSLIATRRTLRAFDFETGKRDKVNVEGRLTKIAYRMEDRSKESSGLAVVRNYENAIKSVRGLFLS